MSLIAFLNDGKRQRVDAAQMSRKLGTSYRLGSGSKSINIILDTFFSQEGGTRGRGEIGRDGQSFLISKVCRERTLLKISCSRIDYGALVAMRPEADVLC